MSVLAPPRTVFEFFTWLDHLELVSPSRRKEWCPTRGQRVAEGRSHEVCLQQGRHQLRLRFTTGVLIPAERIEDIFSTWPLSGARRTMIFSPVEGGTGETIVVEKDAWTPPLLVRSLVGRRLEQQKDQFDEKLRNAKAIIEQAYVRFGPDVFSDGVITPAQAIGWRISSDEAAPSEGSEK